MVVYLERTIVQDPRSFQLSYLSCINKGNLQTYLVLKISLLLFVLLGSFGEISLNYSTARLAHLLVANRFKILHMLAFNFTDNSFNPYSQI